MVLKILGGLYLLGLVGMFIGWAWLRRRAFAEGVWWGLLCVLVPGGSLVFLVRRWDDSRDPFIASALGFACALPLILSNPARFAQSLATGMGQDGLRGALLHGAFPPQPATTARRADPWPIPVEEADEPDAAEPDAEPTPTGPSEAFEREAVIASHAEQRERAARQATYDRHRAEAEALFRDLNARRGRLPAADARAVAAFNADAARYSVLLEQVRVERVTLDQPPVAVGKPDLASPRSTIPPGNRSSGTRLPGRPAAVPPDTRPRQQATGTVAGAGGSQPRGSLRTSLEAAQAARDAASGAEEAGP